MAKVKNTGSNGIRSRIQIVPDMGLLALDGEINRLVLQVELLEARRRRAEEIGERKRIGRQIRI